MDTPVIELSNAAIHATPSRGRRRRNIGEAILSGINMEVYPGELVYLIGKVGSGKSTLLKALYGEIPISYGSGRIAGFDLTDLRKREIPFLRRQLGMVFQDFQLLADRNVYENMRFVLKATGWKNETAIRVRIDEILSLVNLNNKVYAMPYQLSGGEQQRLAVGRAFLNHPDIILADEPTGNLDPETSEDIMSLFIDIIHMGCSVLLATHNISLIENFPSRTLRFLNGCVEEIDCISSLGLENRNESNYWQQ